MFYSVFKVQIQRGVEVLTSPLAALYLYTTYLLQRCQGVRKSFFVRLLAPLVLAFPGRAWERKVIGSASPQRQSL